MNTMISTILLLPKQAYLKKLLRFTKNPIKWYYSVSAQREFLKTESSSDYCVAILSKISL